MLKKSLFLLLLLIWICPLGVNGEEEWQENRSSHFYIYYKDAPKDFVLSVEESAEQYYKDITRDLGFIRYKDWSFEDRAKIYIYKDKEDYIASSKQAGWSQGVAEVNEKTIRTFPSAYGFFDTTLPHELGHIIFREFVGFNVALPVWMDEGVAMFQEKAKRWGADSDVRKAIGDGRLIPLQEMTRARLYNSKDDETIYLFYAEAASVVSFMIRELGESKFAQFCRSLKEGMSFDRALDKNYSRLKSVKDLNDLWLKYLKK